MPWNNQNGGGWQSGGRGPWGQGPNGGRGGGGPQPPDLEDLLKRGQDRFKSVLPGNIGGSGIAILAVILLAVWGFSGIYLVRADEVGVVTRFGEFKGEIAGIKQPGLHYHLPYPIENVRTVKVLTINQFDIGFERTGQNRQRDKAEESLMLTGDENIVDLDFSVFWRIKRADHFLFNIRNPQSTIKAVSESVMREVVGRSERQAVQTGNRENVQEEVFRLLQATLDAYESGIEITEVKLLEVNPPEQVIDAFRDVQAARLDLERLKNQAETYQNRVIPEARGEAERILQEAQAYKEQTIAEAEGEAQRFLSIYEEYKQAKDVTRQRIFLETMERVFADMNKLIVDDSEGQGVVPYLPLPELQRQRQPAAPAQTEGTN